MKKMTLLTAVLVAGLFSAACSGDDEFVAEQTLPDGESYVKLSIKLPTAAATRANDDYRDGEVLEYAVKSATLVLFEGTTEATAVYQNKYDLNLAWNVDAPANDAITTTAEIVQKVSNRTSAANKFYAYVVLNAPAALNTALAGAAGKKFPEVFGTGFKLSTGNLSETVDAANYIPMTNAPLAKYHGGTDLDSGDDGSYSVLSEIDVDKIYTNEAEAASHPATAVYVERIYAKTTLNNDTDNKLVDGDGNALKDADGNEIAFTVLGWTLDNTNRSTYFQRNVDDYSSWYRLYSDKVTSGNAYRFKGNVTNGGKYRIYWATDPNYHENIEAMTDAQLTAYNAQFVHATTGSPFVTADQPQYCYENTFSVADQKQNATTRALLKVQFNGGTAFYTLNNNDKVLYTADLLKQKVYGLLADNATVAAKLDFTVDPLKCTSVLGTATPEKVTVTDVVLKNSDESKSLALNTTELQEVVNSMFNNPAPAEHIRFYNGGIAYYPIMIKHFGDTETPWKTEEHLSTTAYADEGTAPLSRYLGRYGMVRNNWYLLNLQCISSIGEPTIPTPGTGDDDTVNSYIAVKIDVLSWALREQNVKL